MQNKSKGDTKFNKMYDEQLHNFKNILFKISKLEGNEFMYFVYAVPQWNEYFNPYNITETNYEDTIKPLQYYTISRFGVTYWTADENFFTPLEQWKKEYYFFLRIIKIKSFMGFRMDKGFSVWRKNIIIMKFRKAKKYMAERSLIVNEPLAREILDLKSVLLRMENYEMTDIEGIGFWHLYYFLEYHLLLNEDIVKKLRKFRTITKLRLYEASYRAITSAGFHPIDEILVYPSITKMREAMSFKDKAQKRNFCKLLANFLTYCDYMVLNFVHKLVSRTFHRICSYLRKGFGTEQIELQPNRESRITINESRFFVAELIMETNGIRVQPTESSINAVFKKMSTLFLSIIYELDTFTTDEYYLQFTMPSIMGRQEDNLCDVPPDFLKLLKTDVVYKQDKISIFEYIVISYQRLNATIKKLDAARREYKADSDINSTNLKSEKDLETLRTYLQVFHKGLIKLEIVEDEVLVGLFRLDQTDFKITITPAFRSLLGIVENKLPKLASEILDEIEKTTAQIIAKTRADPKNTKETVDYLRSLAEIEKEFVDLFLMVDYAHDTFILMKDFGIDAGEERKELYMDTEDLANRSNEYFIEKSSEKHVLVKMLSEFIVKDFEEILQLSQEIAVEIENPKYLDIASDAYTIEKELAETQRQLQMYLKKANELRGYQREYRIDIIPFQDLIDIASGVESRQNLWNDFEEWSTYKEKVLSTLFFDINVEELTEINTKILKNCAKYDKALPPSNLLQTLKESANEFKNKTPVIGYMRNPYVRGRHWNLIEDLLQRKVYGQDIKIKQLEQCNAFDEEMNNKLMLISSQASGEYQLETMLKAVENVWKETELTLVPYGDERDVYILVDEELATILEDTNINLSTIFASRYIEPIRFKVIEWIQNMNQFAKTLEEWMDCQFLWMYFETIFASADIQRQLPEEAKLFSTVDRNYKETVRKAKKISLAFPVMTDLKIYNIMKENNVHLNSINKCIESYLEVKRIAFPRLYFLSNDELLEILRQTRNPHAVQVHLPKIFDAVNRLEFGVKEYDEKNNPIVLTNDIIAMISAEGEKLTLGKGLKARGNTEDWLNKVEEAMFLAGKRSMKFCYQCFFSKDRIEWFQDHTNQNVLTVSIEEWTADVERVLLREGDSYFTLMDLQSLYSKYLVELANLTRKDITSLLRKVLCALITVDVHSKNSIDILIENNVIKSGDFNWLKMFRFYFDKTTDTMQSKMASATLPYYYEYIGASGVLVLTPLTDKCYLCLMGAMNMNLGGAPAGPAGTGKTETTKNLAKQLAKQCIVFNCSDGLDYKMMGKFFSGLAQCGAWCCFDEFNRINIEVLSVIAQQLITIQFAKKALVKRFMFEGQEIKLIPSCVVFITMNPGYAGRTELPDNLKALFRPMSMMIPDYTLIAEVILYSEGFEGPQSLAQKMVYMYKLCSEQLSQQNHYDFGMRAVKSVLVMAGTLKRSRPDQKENVTLICALRDSNIPKFLPEDVVLFEGILSDLFPNIILPIQRNENLVNDLIEVMQKDNNQPTDYALLKCCQLFDTVNVRWGIMVLGKAASGKSVILNTVIQSISNLAYLKHPFFAPIDAVTLNPKAVTSNELYGYVNPMTLEWRDGLLGKMVRDAVNNREDHFQYVICDGPVDAEWIENLNSVLDDNKLFCLANSERIKLTPWVRMVFEVEDLAQASPATVSRCGMVYMDETQLGWAPVLKSWRLNISNVLNENQTNYLYDLHAKYFCSILEQAAKIEVSILKQATVSKVKMYCNLMMSLMKTADLNKISSYINDIIAKSFIWCVLWATGSNFNADTKAKLESFIKNSTKDDEDIKLPEASIWDSKIDFESNSWISWDSLVKPFEFSTEKKFFELQVPTNDTTKYEFITTLLFMRNQPIMFVGESGVGKSLLAEGMIKRMCSKNYISIMLYFSAKTSSIKTQVAIENKMVKRRKQELDAPPGKKLIAFVDDINMPTPDKYNSQPPIELLRLLADLGGLYDRDMLIWKRYLNLDLAAACAPPGGGRNPMTSRLTRHFSLLQLPKPGLDALQKIFGSILNGFFDEFNAVIKAQADALTIACIDIYNETSLKLLPSPEKSHYIFNLRDLSKCIQGLLQSDASIYQMPIQILKLFVHETTRVFHDRLVNDVDKELFKSLLREVCIKNFGNPVLKENEIVLFGDFMVFGQSRNERVYREITDIKRLDDIINTYLNELTETQGGEKIVLFREALENAVRIARILRVDRGNALLIGLAGMGKQSLTKLASYVNLFQCYQIDVVSNYDLNTFHDDIRNLYRKAGAQDLSMVFLIADSQIIEEEFLEDIGNILTSGEVENLFEADTYEKLLVELTQAGLDDPSIGRENMYRNFITRVKDNLRIVLAMSPIGEAFRRRCRMFPALLNYCTLNWFTNWPVEALYSVAFNFLTSMAGLKQNIPELAEACVYVHQGCEELAERFLEETRRHYYITPSSYMGLLKLFEDLVLKQTANIDRQINRLANGLNTIFETNKMIAIMQADLEILTPQLDKQAAAMRELVQKLEEDTAAADKVKVAVAKDEAVAKEKAIACKAIADDAAADLEIAMPALKEADDALSMLSKADINELKAFATPPALVQFVMEAVCILFGAKPTWASAKSLMADVNFVLRMVKFDKEHITDATIKKLKTYVENKDFQPAKIEKVSKVAKSVSLWVLAMEKFAKIYKVVEPKIKKRDDANAELDGIMKILKEKQRELNAIENKIQLLQDNLEQKQNEFRKVQDSVDLAMARINRANRLAAALVEEETRWKGTTEGLKMSKAEVVGNTMIGAACVSYLGAFTAPFRKEMTEKIAQKIQSLNILCLKKFSLSSFLGESYEIRNWNIAGLPSDDFSIENAIYVTRAIRWPLMIDPQEQANNWIQNLERKNGLVIIRITEKNPSKKIERSIQSGFPMLFENIGESLDSSLIPVLQRKLMWYEGRLLMKLGEKQIEYNPNFKLYMTTKLSNPHYIPEICINVTLINFQVTSIGLTDQLLAQIVAIEQPEIEIRRNDLIVNIDNDKTQLAALEDKVLKLLATAGKKILDDEELVETLNNAKETSIITTSRIADAEIVEKTITENREKYRTLSAYGAVLYSVISRLGDMNPMYQYSLKYFFYVFCEVVKDKGDRTILEVRLRELKYRTLNAIYNKISRSLYGDHKAIFRFLLATAVEIQDKICTEDEFLLLTGVDRGEKGPSRPQNLNISEATWENCVFLDANVSIYKDICSDIDEPFQITVGNSNWTFKFTNTKRTDIKDVKRWDNKLTYIQKLILVKIFKRESLIPFVNDYVNVTIGEHIYKNIATDVFKSAYEDSSNVIPIVFVLSTGSDPMQNFAKLSVELKISSDKIFCISLGQGQGVIAENLMERGSKQGDWVFLQNCHLAKSWMTQLEIYTTNISLGYMQTHADFRLFLSSMPVDYFPVSVLQNSIKLTNEQPKGVRNNVQRSMEATPTAFFENHPLGGKWRTLVFNLSLFHAVIVERKKFGPVGWNIRYEFNDSDIDCGMKQLEVFLSDTEDIPWDALNYINGDVTWGGRVTDFWDQRCLSAMLTVFLNPKVLETNAIYPGCFYKDPKKPTLMEYIEGIKLFPDYDGPEIFGMSENASLVFETQETERFLNLLSGSTTGSLADKADEVKKICLEVSSKIEKALKTSISKANPFDGLYKLDEKGRPYSLNTVVVQEIDRFNIMLKLVHDSINNLKKAIAGLVVINETIELMMKAILVNKVPELWSKKSFLSIKSLANWTVDFQLRIDFIQSWQRLGQPVSFWLSGFYFPQAFLTGVLQTHARKYQIPIDFLKFDFEIQAREIDQARIFDLHEAGDTAIEAYHDLQITDAGVYVHGLYVEAAKWITSDGGLVDEKKGELYSRFPVILLKPTTQVTKGARYAAPVYKTQDRAGTLSTTGHSTNFIFAVLSDSKRPEKHWILRGTALVTAVKENFF